LLQKLGSSDQGPTELSQYMSEKESGFLQEIDQLKRTIANLENEILEMKKQAEQHVSILYTIGIY
jgi:predicted ribosome quality control (RQC) complex YloA/Tae2 family protein